LPNLQNTIVKITQVDNIRNSPWSYSGWGWNYWSGYQDSFITINLKRGTVAKSIQVGFTLEGINMDIKLAGFQLEAIPENRKTVVR
jgi:agmatine/peptidylarginine deiminase